MKLICFDLDNTLVISNKVHLEAFKKAFAINEMPKIRCSAIRDLLSLDVKGVIDFLFPNIPEGKKLKIWKDHNDAVVFETAKKYAKAIRGADSVLKELKKCFRLALVSNCSLREIRAILGAVKIDVKLFDAIIGEDMVGHGKPWPDELELAKKLTKCEAGYMVGDSVYDIRAAHAAGLKPISVTTGNHTAIELSKEKPLLLLNSVAGLPQGLRGLGELA